MKRLLLLGGGHAHVHVLDALARMPMADTSVTLISPYARQIYSGMLPGWIAGHYPVEACAIDLEHLCARAGVPFIQTRAMHLDLNGCTVACEDGTRVPFDWLSIDIGPETARGQIAGADTHALAVRPIEDFISGMGHMLSELATGPEAPIAIIGAGAAGVELAFALRYRSPGTPIRLIGSTSTPLEGLPGRLQQHTLRLMKVRRIEWIGQVRAESIEAGSITLSDGRVLPAAHVLQVTGAAAQDWLRSAGLATDTGGFVRVNPCLQSISHPHVFAVGDIAAYHDPRPKSGVFAVRAGPPLAHNLRRALDNQALTPWAPQRRALYLISTGDRHAMAAWGPFGVWGAWAWRWKDHIDRQFMAQYGT